MVNDDTHVFSDRVLADRRTAGDEFSHNHDHGRSRLDACWWTIMKDDIRSGFPGLVVSVSRLVFHNFSVFSVGVWRVFLFFWR